MVDVLKIGGHAARLAWVTLRSLLGTVFLFSLAGLLLGLVAWLGLRGLWSYSWVLVLLGLLQGVILGVVLGLKRAPLTALAEGLRSLRLGRVALAALFDRVESLAAGSAGVGQSLAKLPVAQAEGWLRQAVADLLHAPAEGGGWTGWVRRALQTRLISGVESLTLARFRSAESGGAVDFGTLRSEMESQVDDVLADKVQGTLRKGVRLGLLLLAAIMAAEVLLIWLWRRSAGQG